MAKEYYDRGTKPLGALQPGTAALSRTNDEDVWSPGVNVDQHPTPRSYLVDNGNSVVRRNRVHLKPVNTTSQDEPQMVEQATREEVQPPQFQTPQKTRGILPARFKDYQMD